MADEGPVARVRPQVRLQVRRSVKGSRTPFPLADKRPDTRMAPQMGRQCVERVKALAAVVVRTSVRCLNFTMLFLLDSKRSDTAKKQAIRHLL